MGLGYKSWVMSQRQQQPKQSPERPKGKKQPHWAPVRVLSLASPRRGSSWTPWGLCSSRLFGACASSSEQGLGAQGPQVQLAGRPTSFYPSRLSPSKRKVRSADKDKVKHSPSEGSGQARNVFRLTGNQRQHTLHPAAHQSQPAFLKQLQQRIGNTMAPGIRRSPSTPPQRLHFILAASHTCSLTQGHECTLTHACTYMYTC